MSAEIFESLVRSAGDLAGVFEFDGETGFFYLYEVAKDSGEKIIDSIHILSHEPDFAQKDVVIRWDSSELKVGLFIRDTLWAVFDTVRGYKYGGAYGTDRMPSLSATLFTGSGTEPSRLD